MIPDPQTEIQIRRFLLGEFGTRAREWDAESVELVEEELITAYLDGELSTSETQSFELHYLQQPGNGAKVQFAQALRRHWSRPRRLWVGALIPGGLTALAVIGFFAWHASTITLFPGGVRDPSEATATVSRTIPRPIRLALTEPLPASQVWISLKTSQDQEIWRTVIRVSSGEQYLSIPFPARATPPGEYHLELHGTANQESQALASYRVKIE